jgi:hypothetical protein
MPESAPMTDPAQANSTMDCLYGTICGFLVPFFLAAAGTNVEAARATVLDLINAYNPATATELDLAGRILGFSIVAMDNLRLSMEPGLPVTKVLRYRSNAVSLSRASEQARKILQAIQGKRETTHQTPRPAVAAAPTPPTPVPQRSVAPASPPNLPSPSTEATSVNIEAMKSNARQTLAAFSRNGAQSSTAIMAIPTPAAFAKSAAAAAVAAIRRS